MKDVTSVKKLYHFYNIHGVPPEEINGRVLMPLCYDLIFNSPVRDSVFLYSRVIRLAVTSLAKDT